MATKKIVGLLLILFFTLPVFSQHTDAVLGKWLNASSEGQIMAHKNDGKYSGKLVWLKEPRDGKGQTKRDSKNPEPALRNRPLLGVDILQDFIYLGGGVWEDGSIYDPKTGKTCSCKISMVSSDQLYIRGYVGIALLGRTETWQRVR